MENLKKESSIASMNHKSGGGFTHLHVHSHYSLLDGLPKIDELLNYVKKLGMDSVAITDHGVLYGAVEFYKKAKAAGIKPIIGAELYLAFEGMRQERPGIDDKKYHLVLLVKNEEGYKNLVELITKAHLEGFYYKPRIDEELLARHSKGLIGLSACVQGKIPRLIIAKKIKEAEDLASKYQEIFGKDNFYLELQHHPNIPEQQKVNDALIDFSKKLGIPLVATCDAHYLKPEDAEAQDVLMLINTGADANDPERLSMKNEDFSLRNSQEMIDAFKDNPEAIENTQKIKKMCNFQFELGKTQLPYFPLPDNKNADDFLKELCYQKMEKRGLEKTEKVLNRLEYELSVIKQTGFAPYFLIVQDFVNWAKDNHIIVGPGRGSAAGSLVSYALNITNVDPLKYDLLFERFLNPERVAGLPDIDLDFTDRRRDEVIEYVAQKYGKDKVAQIITFGTMASRAVVRDVGRALGYAYGYCDQLAKMIPFGFTLEQTLNGVDEFRQLYKSDSQASKLIDLAKKLEGVARHASTHACGVVISKEPLENIVPLQHPTQNDQTIVTQYEMHAIEDLGLLKMDFLGLKNLTIIEDTLARIYKIYNKSINIDDIPQGDEKVFKILQKADTVGIFQLECLSGDTRISNTTIKNLFEKKDKKRLTSVYLDEGKTHLNEIIDVLEGGEKEIYNLITENNWHIKASKDHYFLTKNGWKKLGEIKAEEEVLIKIRAKHFLYNLCKGCGKQINGQKEGKSNFCYRCSAKFYSNPSKKISREKIKTARIKFYKNGGKPWNVGLNIENSAKVVEIGKTISRALSGKTLEYRYGKKKAREIKKKMSIRFRGKGNPMFGKPSPHRMGGIRDDLRHYVRSNWEADFARILKFYNLDYKYEPETFELVRPNGEILHYTPDFYVPSQNTFYEIKGWLHDLDQEKMKLFKEQYPRHKFILINKTKFAELALKYKNLIRWECPRIPTEQSFRFMKVKQISYAGREKTYDIMMRSPGNNFVANGFLVHNSGGMQRYLKQLKPTEFEDIIAMVALYRPGPMEFIPDYINRKHGKKIIEYLHPKLKPILEKTQGIMIYQEQLMQIARDMAGFTMGEADFLRKAVGKKIKSLLMAQEEKMIQGMVKNGIDKKIAEEIWQWILPFAHYGFNRSHSASYATIAYQTAWLKTHYPVEFMSAVLTSEKADVERIAVLIEECKKMKIEVLPPDINESFMNFSVVPDKNQIRFGLLAIKNVGEKVVEAILKERKDRGPFAAISDFVSRVNSKDLNKKSFESMIKAGVFDKLGERNQLIQNMEKLLEESRQSQKSTTNGQKGLFDLPEAKQTSASWSIKLTVAPPSPESEKLKWEKELLGLYISGHPLKNYRKIMEKKCLPIAQISQNLAGRVVRIGGVISTVKKIITKKGQPMLFVNLEDEFNRIELVVFPSTLENYPALFQENKIVFVSGKVDMRDNIPKIICNTVEEIVEE